MTELDDATPSGELEDELGAEVRDRAGEDLASSLKRYQALVEDLREIIFRLDDEGTVTFVSTAWMRILGLDPGESVGRKLGEYMRAEDRTWFEATLARRVPGTGAGSGGDPPSPAGAPGHSVDQQQSREISMLDARGRAHPVAISMTAVDRGWVGSLRDRTEERHAEEQLKRAAKMETVGQLARGISHDFNNLLTVIAGNLDLIRMRVGAQVDQGLDELFGDAFSALEDGIGLVAHVQSFSQDQPSAPSLLDVEATIDVFSGMLSRSLTDSIRLQTDCAKDMLLLVDERRLKSALLNLSLNARDAMPEGGTFAISVYPKHVGEEDRRDLGNIAAGDYVAIAAQDTGCGIPEDVLGRVCEPFFTTKPPGQGSGLGLSMVADFAQRAGGAVHIESAPSEGTRVTIVLPRMQDQASLQSGESPDPATPRGSESVLVVEDDERVRKYAVRCLTELGYEVVSAESGVAALELLGEHAAFDAVFSDVVMPGGVSGHDLAARMEAEYGDAISILLTSGYVIEYLGETQDRWTMLTKPYTVDQLGRSIREVLDR